MTEEVTGPTKDQLRQTYDMATQRLRETHRDEFIQYRQEAAAELGIEWEPRLTAEQRAERDFDRLLAEYPHLKDRLAPAE